MPVSNITCHCRINIFQMCQIIEVFWFFNFFYTYVLYYEGTKQCSVKKRIVMYKRPNCWLEAILKIWIDKLTPSKTVLYICGISFGVFIAFFYIFQISYHTFPCNGFYWFLRNFRYTDLYIRCTRMKPSLSKRWLVKPLFGEKRYH